jgi:hypothetical protein
MYCASGRAWFSDWCTHTDAADGPTWAAAFQSDAEPTAAAAAASGASSVYVGAAWFGAVPAL